MGWLSLCLVLILLLPPVTPGGGVMFETLCSSAVGRAALTARALSRECVMVYCPRPLRKAMGWWVRVPFGNFLELLVKRGAKRSSFEEAERVQNEPIISYDRFMTSDRLRSKGVMNELGAGRTVESFTRKPLDKYQSLSIAFRKRHGLGLSKDEVEGKALFMNWENGKNESNDEKEDEYDDSEVWWEDQIHKKGGRRNVARFPIRLGSVLKRRRRQWMKSSSSSLDDDSGLESEEEEEEAQDASMENSFDGSSDDLESEERIACDDDSTTVPTYLQEYKYQNEEEWKGIEDDRPYDPLNGDNEWGLFEETDDVHYRNLEDENEQWEDHHQCDFEEQQDWSDDNDPVMTSVTPAVEQWGCKDPSEGVHQYGGGIHDQSNRKFRKKYGNGDGEFAEDESEGVWDGNDEDEWMFGNSLEDNKSEEEESFVGYDDDSEEEQSNYENSDDDEHHNSGMSSYSHEEEEI